MKEKGTISIHTENIFPIIKKFLYSDNEIFLRELVSNAVDATQKIKRLSSLGQFKGELGNLQVEIAFDPEKKTITISDQGIGMTAEEVKKYINQIAFSGASEFLEQYEKAKDSGEIIGKFGLGFYSAFMVAGRVEIETLSYKEDAEAVNWVCDGSTSFEISKGARKTRGTDIILHINEDAVEFLDRYRLQEILDKYCKFLPVPIKFGTNTEKEPDGEDQEGKPKFKDVEKDNIINNTAPAWVRKPADLKDEDYLAFYRELYPMSPDPLFWIHLNVDYPFNLTGILYFPAVKNDLEFQRNQIKLFSRQVFITDQVKDIVPDFLMLLHGVIDSPDIPLNVSRSFLQADSSVKKINSYISKKVADKLNELFRDDREAYQQKWKDIGLFVKYGMITDEKFYDKARECALLGNVKGEYFTLDEYREKVSSLQTGKDGNLVYLYATDPAVQDGYIQSAEKKGYDILLMDGPVDNHFVSQLEQKLEKTTLRRVDSDVADKLIPTEDAIETVLNDEQKTSITEVFGKAVDKPEMTVAVESLSPGEPPVTVTVDEFTQRMKEMAKSGGMDLYGGMPDRYKVVVNGNHPLTLRILNAGNPEQQELLARQAFDLALLSRGMLTGAELTAFVNRSVHLIGDQES